MSVTDELKKKYGGRNGTKFPTATSAATAAATGRTEQKVTGSSPVRKDAAPRKGYSIRSSGTASSLREKYANYTPETPGRNYQERVHRALERDTQAEEQEARDAEQGLADLLAEYTGIRTSANELKRKIDLASGYAAVGGQYDKANLEREREELLREYGGENGLAGLISDLERRQMNSRVESHRLTRVNNPYSSYYDPEFASLSGLDSGITDATYRWINDEQYRKQLRQLQEIAQRPEYTGGVGEAQEAQRQLAELGTHSAVPFEEAGLELMTADEIALYNYHYAKGGAEQAGRYLDAIADTLNQRRGQKLYEGMEGNTAKELFYGIDAGFDQYAGSIQGLLSGEELPTSARQYASELVRQDMEDVSIPVWYNFKEGAWEDKILGASVGQMAYDAITTTSNMVPSILATTVTNMVAPGLGSAVGLTAMSAGAAGSARQEALRAGYSNAQATSYGLLVGAAEASMEKLLGGISALGGKGLGSKALGKLGDKLTGGKFTGFLNNLDSAFLRVAGEVGESMLSEGTEEYVQEIIDPLLRNAALGEENEVALYTPEALYSGLLGALTGGGMEGPRVVRGGIAQQREAALRAKAEKYGDQAEHFVQNYQQGQNPELYDNNYNLVFEEAKAGVGLDHVLQNEETAKYLTDEQIEQAWQAGKAAGGWATMRQSGESVKVKGVAEAGDGFELELEDGKRVKRGDVILSTHSEELALRGIEGLKLSAEDSNALLSSFREGDTTGDKYARGVQAAFQAGGKNIPMQELSTKASAAGALSEAQRVTAYELGRKYAKAQVQREQAALTGTATAPGRVHYDGDVSKLTEIQQTSVKALETVAGALGVQIHVFESYENGEGQRVYKAADGMEVSAPNGWYDTRTGDIHIDLNAGADGRGTMLFTAAHELTHWVKQWSPAKFKALADFLMEQYGEKGVSVEELIERQQAKARRVGRDMDYDAAFEELVADSMEAMLADGEIVEKLARLKKQDKSLWEKLKEKISELVGKLKAAYKGLKPDSKEGKYVAEMLDAAEELKRLFAEGLEDAGRNFRVERAENAHSSEGATVRESRTVGAKNATTESADAPESATGAENAQVEGDAYDPALDYERPFSWRDNEKTALSGGDMQARTVDGKQVVWIEENILADAKGIPVHQFIADYIASRIGEVYTIIESGQKVYIGEDLPGEYTQSKYTKATLQKSPSTIKAKNRAAANLGEMIEIATNRRWEPTKHPGSKDAKYGMYRYDTRFGFPIKDHKGNAVRANIYTAELLIRNASDGKKYLYDVVKIKKDTASSDWLTKKMASATANAAGQKGDVSKKSVAQDSEGVNTKFSMRDSEGRDNEKTALSGGVKFSEREEAAFAQREEMIVRTVDEAIANKGVLDAKYNQKRISAVPVEVAEMVKAASDGMVDVSQKYIALGGSEVWHEFQRHTDEATEHDRGQIAFTKQQFVDAIKSIYKPDLVECIFRTPSNPTQRQSFAYVKRAVDGHYVVVEAVGGKKNPHIVPVEILYISESKWEKWIGSGKTVGEMLFENDGKKLSALDMEFNKKNRVTAAQFASDEAIASTPHSPRSDNIVAQDSDGVNAKFSMRDTAGRELTQEQAEYFKNSKVRDADGNLMVMYHGTPNGKHTTFRPGTYFTPNREYADVYQKPGASMLSSKKNADAPKTYEVYLNITKPFDTRNPKERRIFMREYYRQWGTGAPLADSGLPDWTDGMDLQEFIEEMEYDYDGLILDEGATGGYGLEVKSRGLSYVVFDSSQVKNVDNRNPTDDPDIRYSVRDYAYDTLVNKPDMTVTTVGGTIPNDRADVVALAKKNAARVGKVDPKTGSVSVHVDDIDTDVLLGRDGLKHGLRRTKNPQNDANYIVTVKAGEIIKNSIKINEANPKSKNAAGAYVMIGAARNTNGDLYVVRSIVNQFSNELDSMDVLYAINAKKESAALNAPLSAGNPALGTDSTISIAELLDHVNQYFPDILPEEVLKHYDYDARPEGDFGENVLYSERDPAVEKLNRALQKENAAQKAEIGYLKELVGLQSKITNGTKFTRSSVETLAGMLMKEAGARGDRKELAVILNGVYEYIAGLDDPAVSPDWEDIAEQTGKAAQWLMEHAEVKPQREEYADEILKELRTMRISLNQRQMAEAVSRYGSYNDFRKSMFGSVVVARNGTPLDVAWQDLAAQYPGTFDPDTNDADMPLQLAGIIDSLRNSDLAKAEFEANRESMAEELRQKVYEGYWKVSTLRTVADKWQKKLDDVKSRHGYTMEQLKQARSEAREADEQHRQTVRELRREQREAVRSTEAKVAKYYQDARQKATEGRHKTAMRHRIENTVKELEGLLLRGNKKRNVKEGMRSFVEEALASASVLFTDSLTDEELILNGIGTDLTPEENHLIDEAQHLLSQKKDLLSDAAIAAEAEAIAVGDTGGYDERMERLDSLEKQINYRMVRLQGVLTRERARLNKATVGGVLKNLSAAYKALGQSDDLYIRGAAREEVWQHLDGLIGTIGGTRVRDMTLAQLEDVHKAFRMVLTTVRDANKLFTEGQKQTLSEAARTAAMEVTANGKNSKLGVELVEELKKFGINNLKPVYFFEHLNSNTLRQLYKGLMKGQDTWARDVTEAREYYLQAAERYGMKGWDQEKTFTFRSSSGKELKLNVQQMMSLYAYSRRPKARDHIRKGGIVFAKNTEVVVQTKKGIKVKYNYNDATAYGISDDTLGEIIGKLTKEQKLFVEEMQKYLSETMGGKGNEVSMTLYGVRLFNEKAYFPLRSAHQYMARAKEQAEQTAKIKNAGFTKPTDPKANNAVVLGEFMDVWSDHVNEMSLYHGMTLPLDDLHRVYTYSQTGNEDADSQSVTAAIENAFGSQATDYIDQLMKDLNSRARVDNTTGIINKSMALFKKGSTFLSASVVIQQPSAINRATALVDSKYFEWAKLPGKWGLDLTFRRKQHDRLWGEVKQYAPVALIKEMGYFDTSVGRSTRDFIQAQEYITFDEKMKGLIHDSGYRDEVLSRAPALADELAWCSIWEAVKREQHDVHPKMQVGSEEFLRICGERFTEVIDRTQVYDSVLARSANMRSKDTGMKMATAFMAEPTVSANMVVDALLKGKRGDKKFCRRAIGSVISSGILNAMLYSIVAAARDDDEDKEYWEKYLGSLTGEVFEVINPATYLPFARDVWSLIQGYDVERSDMALVADLVNAIRAFGSDSKTGLEKVEQFSSTVLKLFGLPLGNIWRDAKALWRVMNDAVDGQGSTAAGIGYAVMENLPFGKAAGNGQQLYDARISGNAEQEARVAARYKDASGAQSALRKALRENDPRIREAAIAWNEGRLEDYMAAAKRIIAEKHFKQDDVVAAIQAEAKSLLPDQEAEESETRHKGLFTAAAFAVAAADGDADMMNAIREDLVQTAMDNGKTQTEAEKSVNSSIKSEVKECVLGDLLTDQQAKAALTGYCGMAEKEAEDAVLEWTFEKQNGYPLSELEDAFVGGLVGADKAEGYLGTYGGYARAEAQSKVLQWKCEKDTGIRYDDVQQLYVDGEMTADRAKELRVKYGESSLEDARKTVLQWTCEKDTGIKYTDIDVAYLSGDIAEKTAIDYLVKYGEKTPEKAELTVQAYQWRDEHTEYKDLSDTAIDRYIDYCEDAGISIPDFYEANKRVAEIKAAGGTQKENVVRYIRSLNLSRAQKWAMWYAVKTTNWKDNVSF